MSRCLALLFALMLIAGLCACAGSHDAYRWRRITTSDPAGRNDDFIALAPHESRVIADIKGPGEIVHLWLTIGEFSAKAVNRQVVLSITWDDAAGPSVLAPVGDFFNVPRGKVEAFENQFLSVQDVDSLNSYFPMPFRKRALVRLENQSDTPVYRAYAAVTWKERRFTANDQYFHAMYRQEKPAVPLVPYQVADIVGRGRYIGHNLSVVLNGGGWWGEGDDIYTVDGTIFPGTGSEDAFGGAWGFGRRTSSLRTGIAQVANGLDRGGLWNLYRFHSEAPIPFRKNLRMEFEHGLNGYDARPGIENNYQSVAFYSATKPQIQQSLPPLADRLLDAVPINGPLPGGWIEAETSLLSSELYPVTGLVASAVNRAKDSAYSGHAMANLVALKSGDRFVWSFDLPTTGTLRPELAMDRQPSGFNFSVMLNGKALDQSINGYDRVVTREVVRLPTVMANAGRNILEIVANGTNPAATAPAIQCNLDAIRFVREVSDLPIDVRPRPSVAPDGMILHRVLVKGGKLNDEGDGASQNEFTRDVELMQTFGSLEPDAIRFRKRGDRISLSSPHNTELADELEISFFLYAEPSEKNMAIFSRNQVMSAWLNNGKLSFWMRDIDWRFLYIETKPHTIPEREWVAIRLTLNKTIARIFVNGATVSETDMKVFGQLNQYPGPLALGGSENELTPFRGGIGQFTLRAGTPAPAAGEE